MGDTKVEKFNLNTFEIAKLMSKDLEDPQDNSNSARGGRNAVN